MSHLAKPALSAERGTALGEYLSDLRGALGLRHWVIRVPDEWPDDAENVFAATDPCVGRFVATIRLGANFWDQDPHDLRDTLVHELLHLHHVRLTDVIRLGEYKSQLGQGLYDHLNDQVRTEAEYMIDALTSIVAPTMPLPPAWPDA